MTDTIEYRYDTMGNLLSAQDEDSSALAYRYDRTNRLTRTANGGAAQSQPSRPYMRSSIGLAGRDNHAARRERTV